MRELYDQLVQEGEIGIDRLIAERTQESLQLDFKRKESELSGEFSTNDRRILAQALSGFANSAGGLLIVGVDARPGDDRVDCAQEARPLSNIRKLLSDAQTEIGRLVQPRLEGVLVNALYSERSVGSGYLLIYVERSDRRPHRSEAKGQKAYYKRHGDSFFEMEHYDIEDAFSRTGSPRLELRHVIRQYMRSGNDCEFNINFYIKNVSDFIGKFPYIVFENGLNYTIPPYNDEQPLKAERGVNTISLMGGSDDVVHPYTEKHVAVLRTRFVRYGDHWVMSRTNGSIEIEINCLFGCEGSRALRQKLSLSASSFGLVP